MTGLHEVACGACGKRHVMSAARARAQRVLRCDCGQFVRLDRALVEANSDPAPTPPPHTELADADDDDDDQTHMLTSLEAIAALGATSGGRASRASSSREDDAASTRIASSAAQLPSQSIPPARPSSPAPARRPSSPVQSVAGPATDKPLWYVDLGGAETVEMTIEQLIIARRSGKLGEGALVWRAGMPRWRSVGSLIPAAGSGAPRQAAPAAAPTPSKPPTPVPLGSYERPVATLEFALEKPEAAPARARASRTPSPAKPRPASPPPPRVPTPIPRIPTRGASQIGPLPTPTPLPPVTRLPTPVPPAPSVAPAALAQAMSSVSPLMGRASPMPQPRSVVPAVLQYPWRGQHPRWLSIGIAIAICIAASGSGAFLVRALKLRRQPLSLSPTQLNAAPAQASANASAPIATVHAALPATAGTTAIVDIDSLSVERRAPRAPVRPVAPPVPAPPSAPAELDKGAENTASDEPSSAADTPQPAAKKVKAGDLPAAAHSNQNASSTVGDSNVKKPAPSSSDDPGF